MRKKIVAGNWKMNMTMGEGSDLVNELLVEMPKLNEHKQVVIAPTFVLLSQTFSQLESTAYVQLGAQDCHTEANGAYTGEVSAGILKSAGVQYVIIGHSERRQYQNETDEVLLKKVNQALNNGMEVIFCCGEPLSVREAGNEEEYVKQQIVAVLAQMNRERLKNVTIAYEPIWAIGTGKTATTAQAQAMHAHIRQVIATQFDE
ncbi:MAG: triose-phosphate isomerase, partial [Chitinophagia bacterium]|nr:triose-phosphate isomerase [Chitinophagia bacterium]